MSLVSILLVDVHSVVYRKPTSTTIEKLQEPQTYKYYSLSKTYKYYRKPTGVYRKPAITDIYINWNAHAPTEWKMGTFRNLIKLEKLICSDESLVKEEMKYLTKVFHEVNDYSMSVMNTIAQQELNDSQNKIRKAETSETSNKIQLILPCSGKLGKKLITK